MRCPHPLGGGDHQRDWGPYAEEWYDLSMTPRPSLLALILPAAAAALALALFAAAGWNALQAGVLPGLMQAAAQAQPVWFCH